jgi:glycosyltransferase involved in cell wall biosynthesis
MSKYYGGVKNIIQYQTETSNFRKIRWQDHINMMDEAWVFSKYSREASKSSGVKIPLNIVPMPVDTSKFGKDYGVVSNLKESVPNNAFIFYTISEFTSRKNIEALLKAFHSEFHITEPVYLLIKTSTNDQQRISGIIDGVKRGLKIYDDPNKYKKELIVFNHLPEEEIYKIHQSGHAFVTASHAEGWCLPAFDALGFGKPVIAPRHTSFVEYLNDKNSYLVDAYEDICYDAPDTLPELYSASENWYNVSVLSLRKQMRAVYQQKDGEAAKRALQGKKRYTGLRLQKRR